MRTDARDSVETVEGNEPQQARVPNSNGNDAVDALDEGDTSTPAPLASGALPSPSAATRRTDLVRGQRAAASERTTTDVSSGNMPRRRGPPIPPEARQEWRMQRRESNRRARIESQERRRSKVEAEEKRIAELENILSVRPRLDVSVQARGLALVCFDACCVLLVLVQGLNAELAQSRAEEQALTTRLGYMRDLA